MFDARKPCPHSTSERGKKSLSVSSSAHVGNKFSDTFLIDYTLFCYRRNTDWKRKIVQTLSENKILELTVLIQEMYTLDITEFKYIKSFLGERKGVSKSEFRPFP